MKKTIYNNLTNKYKTLKKQEIELDPVECYKQLERENWKLWEDNFRELSETKNNHLSKITKTPNKKPWFIKSKLANKNIKLINRILTGHAYNKKFLYLCKISEDDECEKCGSTEDNNHILFECRFLEQVRAKFPILKKYKNTIDLFNNIKPNQYHVITSYLKEIDKKL